MSKEKRSHAAAGPLPKPRAFRPILAEALESRQLFSAFVVTSISDAAGVTGTLRAEIALANTSTTPSTITFSPTVFATAKTIKLSGTGLVLTNIKEPITITGPKAALTISGNAASRVFYVNPKVTASISTMTLTDGFSTGNGGAVGDAGTLTLTHITISNSKANGNGAGLAAAGKLTMTNCTVSGNSSASADGGVDIQPTATATITNTTISLNVAHSSAGGIENYGTLVMLDDTVSGNHQSANFGLDGGGVLTYSGHTTLTNCTIANNKAVGSGGGICNENLGTTNIYNCTICDNYSAENAGGVGGGVANLSGVVNIANTIIAANTVAGTSSPDAFGHFTSKGHNLVRIVGSASSGWIATDKTGTISKPLNAVLGVLQNNGGPTLTVLPASTSPAINGGSVVLIPSGITTDQRGHARIINGKVDIGAVEVG
ncbi:MAG TPA: choice-of-anchor Q domain-containing protein [Tepidisphaeraceae bacterium]|jgi:hypothetical protein|nr:choice-of-anchor Q domain-containing protein [Tepidisphaeraceae bacterium]